MTFRWTSHATAGGATSAGFVQTRGSQKPIPGIAAEIAINGAVVDLTGNEPRIVEYVEAGRTYLDGSVLIGAMEGVVRDRIRMALNGAVFATMIFDEEDRPLGDAWVELMGLPAQTRNGRPLAEARAQAKREADAIQAKHGSRKSGLPPATTRTRRAATKRDAQPELFE